ncbi:winged helix-turn-helix domain-containing protein [Fluviispira sanaruensis]|uniref:Restriction endonuclease n=1 Tax=Fluviispira sanaruensis TaxID=2493639 RepID=A0A4P2VGJ0_FLUSA|nr:winged helix-turn-helix domain-containing protein [Fluviispira sanaruensis]BBH51993.1 restriction endonuclease [Fluviispira sanaruensis]
MLPKYHQIMLPFLKLISDEKKHRVSELGNEIAKYFDLNERERREVLPSGAQTVFDNRVGWAKTYLKKAGLIYYPERGFVLINSKGKALLSENLTEITPNYLRRYDEFLEFKSPSISNSKTFAKETIIVASQENLSTPQEALEAAYRSLNNEIIADLISNIENCSAFFFEKLVVDLLINMGYGGSRKEAGKAFQSTGDGGIDGIIKEDRLGLDAIKIILINGTELAEYMIETNTGVSVVDVYKIKKIDLDYFQET